MSVCDCVCLCDCVIVCLSVEGGRGGLEKGRGLEMSFVVDIISSISSSNSLGKSDFGGSG